MPHVLSSRRQRSCPLFHESSSVFEGLVAGRGERGARPAGVVPRALRGRAVSAARAVLAPRGAAARVRCAPHRRRAVVARRRRLHQRGPRRAVLADGDLHGDGGDDVHDPRGPARARVRALRAADDRRRVGAEEAVFEKRRRQPHAPRGAEKALPALARPGRAVSVHVPHLEGQARRPGHRARLGDGHRGSRRTFGAKGQRQSRALADDGRPVARSLLRDGRRAGALGVVPRRADAPRKGSPCRCGWSSRPESGESRRSRCGRGGRWRAPR
mmetsp:Transcript_23845/g.94563  ORF Transcript_23845/g.94563 Transcript_23845/m.94563 type:complete len:271 (+) Transcript_23845:147-959(+)